jgi:hypothetical protein
MKYWIVPDNIAEEHDLPTDLESFEDGSRFTIAFRLRDTQGLLYHHAYNPLSALNYMITQLEQGAIIKGVKRDEI